MSGEGHRYSYVRYLVDELVAQGSPAMLLTSDSGRELDAFETHLGRAGVDVRVTSRGPSMALLSVAFGSWRTRHIVIPEGDGYLWPALLVGLLGFRCRCTLLIMRDPARPIDARGIRRIRTVFKRALLWTLARAPRSRIVLLRSALMRTMGGDKTLIGVGDPIVFEPGVSRNEARTQIGISTSRYWFCVAGTITARKNVPIICEALGDLQSETSRDLGLLIAGRVTPSYRAAVSAALDSLESRNVATIWIDRVLSDRELDSAILGADAIVVAHSNSTLR